MVRTQTVCCNLCGGTDSVPLYTARDRSCSIEGNFTYVRCNTCGLVYMNPQVIPEDIGKLYPEVYAPYHHDTTKKRFGILSEIWKNIFKSVKLDKSIGKQINQQSRVLDIGCGSGDFLNEIKNKHNCEIYGLDMSETAIHSAKQFYNIDVFKGTISEAPWTENYFDIITAWHYMEHVNNPNQNVQKMAQMLKPGGWLVLGVPNIESFGARHFKDKWYPLECPRHLCIWSPKTMELLIQKNGLRLNNIIYAMDPWWLVTSLQYQFYDNKANAEKRDHIFKSKFTRIAFLPWLTLMSVLKQSDGITVYARKE